ncbi:8708_t:CDS:2, partial [Funneliformis geosporum]
IKTYFEDTPILEWSYPGFLRALKPFCVADCYGSLKDQNSIWRKRFNTFLRKFLDSNEGKEEELEYVALLLEEDGNLLFSLSRALADSQGAPGGAVGKVQVEAFWKDVQLEREMTNQAERERMITRHKSNVDALKVINAARNKETHALVDDYSLQISKKPRLTSRSSKQVINHSIWSDTIDDAESNSEEKFEKSFAKKDNDEKVQVNMLAQNKDVSLKTNTTLAEKECIEEEVDEENEEQDVNMNYDNPEYSNDDVDVENVEEQTAFVLNIFQEFIAVSSMDKKLADIFKSLNTRQSIMDLRPASTFSLAIDTTLHEEILHQVFDPIDLLITDDLHSFLTDFFNADHGPEGWDTAVEGLLIYNTESEIVRKAKKLLKRTLVQFFKAFSLNAINPLRDLTILEKPHLNQFVHPVIDAALWIFGKVNYIYGEIPVKKLKSRIRVDGIGYINDVTNYALVCGEGAKPGATTKKRTEDINKNAASMARLYNDIIIAEADARHQLLPDLRTYGMTSHRTEVSLTMLDFRDVHRIFEVDRYSLPQDWVDMPKFAHMYEAVIKWALCICSTKEALIANRKKRRMTRYSEVRLSKRLTCLKNSEAVLETTDV